jgi:hypothetical protein
MTETTANPAFSDEEMKFKEKAAIGRTKNYGTCNKCNGTGRRGFITSYHGASGTPSPIPCKCVTRVLEAEAIAADLKYREEHPEEFQAPTEQN